MPLDNPQLHLVETYDDAQQFMSWLGNQREWMGVDSETTGLDWWKDTVRLVQVGDTQEGWAIPFDRWSGLAQEALNRYDGKIVMHNSKFDMHFLEKAGIDLKRHRLHDSRAMVHILEPHKFSGLKPAAKRHVDRRAGQGDADLKLAMMKGKWTWATVPIDLPQYWVYSALDPVLTACLAEKLYPQLGEQYRRVYETEVAVAQVLCAMETRGIRIDVDYIQQKDEDLKHFIYAMESWFHEQGVSSPGSDAQMIKWLQADGVTLTKKTAKGKLALDNDVLEGIDHPVAAQLIRYRKATKTKSTYFDGFLEHRDGDVIHGSINPLGARTGRMSASRPNLQNVPRSAYVRDAFIPRDGNKFVLSDFDQIELRIMAHYADERGLIDAVLEGEDLHTFIGRMIYRTDTITDAQRQVTKAANFAKIYGAGVDKFSDTAGITRDEAKVFMDTYDATFPGIRRFMTKLTGEVSRNGFVDTPYLGRRQYAERDAAYKIVNYFVQGTAADVLKKKIVELAMTEAGQYMLIPIHDEIAFDVPEDLVDDVAREVATTMTEAEAFAVPLSVGSDIVSRWGEKYD